ncbi:hypothetical protein PHYSODRAFT_308156 [Phytophthora sojae]|uniref:Uncharacterized protein n=1 Tax=Phytophthora sojae (strain P6497) TaxID=1094619 RepID=G5AIJ8_PHYSP|nr:hypothetical protein PHYSODRAFT_308156 [Phytophthora sojae]EGZ04608.1 hypothetical protein PHYSODRAFT_308156 [Phytophthora sojae]|eukprot:XP_009539899.1 hypothetical protein PHYSODRAFT_308156 [Phytophthora sojae]
MTLSRGISFVINFNLDFNTSTITPFRTQRWPKHICKFRNMSDTNKAVAAAYALDVGALGSMELPRELQELPFHPLRAAAQGPRAPERPIAVDMGTGNAPRIIDGWQSALLLEFQVRCVNLRGAYMYVCVF